jgi:sodium transport system ATP-binding protein
MAQAELRLVGLRKAFARADGSGPLVAVDGLSFTVGAGEVCGLLGPNGAGKTTTLRMAATLLPPDAGELWVDGVDARAAPLEARRRLGYVPAEAGLPPRLSPREVVSLFAELHGIAAPGRRAVALLEELGAGAWLDRACGTLSTGMKRRVVLARALVHEPAVLLLDEPTDGLDVGGRREVLAMLRRRAVESGCAVLLSSHIMSEVASVADTYVVMARGCRQATGSREELLAATGCTDLDAAFLQLVAP